MNEIRTVGLIGLGAVGALYAERMLASGADLRVIVDEERRERYGSEGVHVNGARVDFPYVTPAQASPVDLLLIVTKANGLHGAMETAAGFIGEDTLIVSLLNGVTSEEIVAGKYGWKNVLCSVAQGMDAVKEGNRLTYVHPGRIVLGEREPGEISARVQMVADYLNAHGVVCTPVGDMVRRQWGKLMLNVGLNQACMVFECDYGGVQQPGRAREPRDKAAYLIDFNAQMALNAYYMSAIGDILNDKEISFKYKKKYYSLKTRIDALMWDDEDQFYYDLNRSEAKVKVKTLASYWTMLAQIPSEDKAEAMVQKLMDGPFSTENPFPSLATDSKAYNQNGKGFCGSVYPHLTFMVIKGLEKYERHEFAREYLLGNRRPAPGAGG